MPAKAKTKANATAIFSKATLEFLAELGENNERAWFEANRGRFEAAVQAPALALVRAMVPELRRVAKSWVADDKKVGGSLMRIHRDVRFSSDKSPYKTNIGLNFRHRAGKGSPAPGLYVHIAPEGSFLGVGIWHPEPDVLAAIRKRIVDKPRAWTTARNDRAFAKSWKLDGDVLARPPRGFDPEHPLIDDLKRKDHIAGCEIPVARLCAPDLPKWIGGRFAEAMPYMKFLCGAVGVPA
jgi:uncharacterized protein (TIGR02453 family)